MNPNVDPERSRKRTMPRKRRDELHEGRAAGYRRTGGAMRRIAAEGGVTPGTVSRSLTLAGTPERRGDRGDSPGSRTGDYPSTRDTLRPAFDDRARRSRETEPLPSRALGGSTHARLPERLLIGRIRRCACGMQSPRSFGRPLSYPLPFRNHGTFVVCRCRRHAAPLATLANTCAVTARKHR